MAWQLGLPVLGQGHATKVIQKTLQGQWPPGPFTCVGVS